MIEGCLLHCLFDLSSQFEWLSYLVIQVGNFVAGPDGRDFPMLFLLVGRAAFVIDGFSNANAGCFTCVTAADNNWPIDNQVCQSEMCRKRPSS